MNKSKIKYIFCILVSLSTCIGNFIITVLTRQLIDTPEFGLVVKLGMIWIFLAIIILVKTYMVQIHYLQKKKLHLKTLLKSIIFFPFPFLESKQYHDELTCVKDLAAQEQAFLMAVADITSAGFGIFGLFALLYNQASMLILLLLSVSMLFVILLSVCINGKLSILMYDYWKKYMENTQKYNYISEVLSNKEYVEERKVFSYLPFFLKQFDKEFNAASQKNRTLGGKRIKLELLSDIIFFVYSLFGFLILYYAYTQAQISIGLFVSGSGYFLSLAESISAAIGGVEDIIKFKKINIDFAMFMNHADRDSVLNRDDLPQDFVLSIKNVTFKYPTNDTIILDDINFSFQKGKKYAMVGVNGCGKTTLVKIISGLYTPLSGTVSYKNKPVVLFQDFNKYPTTLKENIILSDNPCMEENKRLPEVEKNAGLAKKISSMKFGDNTKLTALTKEGEELSGGQWQRVALARILWNDAELYILDEPTASLDPIEEIRIFETYNKILQDKTVIYITHRLGFVKDVDEIIVLNEGHIIESGTHEALLKLQNGFYKNMFEEQRSWYE